MTPIVLSLAKCRRDVSIDLLVSAVQLVASGIKSNINNSIRGCDSTIN